MTPEQNHARPRPPRRRFGRAFAVAALVGVVLGLTGPAHSYWTASSTGAHARSEAATLPAPELTATPMTATSAGLSWTRPFEPTGYDLAQTPASLTGCAAHPTTSTVDCTASELTPNTSYEWSLSAALHSWRSPATVTATTPKQATTTTISNTTPQSGTAGSAFSAIAKVTGKSGYGTPAGTVTFSLYPTAGCTGQAGSTTAAQPVTDGSATGSLQPAAGTYYWQATYTPTDTYNTASTSACGTAITVTAPKTPPTVTVGASPVGVAVSPDGAHVYVANYSLGTVSVIDTATNTVSTISVGGNPIELALSPDGTRLYVTKPNVNAVIVVDTASGTLVKTIAVGSKPYGVAVSPDGERVYVANYGGSGLGSVSQIDAATNMVTATITVEKGPYGVAVTPDGERVYVTNAISDTVSVIGTATNTVLKTIAVGNQDAGVAVSPDGKHVYVSNEASSKVSVIDTATNTVSKTITVGRQPSAVAVSPDGTRVYITNDASNPGSMSVIDTATNTVLVTIPVETNPDGVAVSPDGTRVYVTNEGSGTVSVIAVPVLSAGTVPAAKVGDEYVFPVPAVNATSFTITSGALPAGLGLDAATGMISGTPTTAGPVTFTVTGAGAYGQKAAMVYTIDTTDN